MRDSGVQVFSGRLRSTPCQSAEGAARSLSKAVSPGWSRRVQDLWAQGQRALASLSWLRDPATQPPGPAVSWHPQVSDRAWVGFLSYSEF